MDGLIEAHRNGLLRRLRAFEGRSLVLEISSDSAREGDVGELWGVELNLDDVGADGFMLLSHGGENIGRIDLGAEQIIEILTDPGAVGLSFGQTFLKFWEQDRIHPHGLPEMGTPPKDAESGIKSEMGGCAADHAGLPFYAVVEWIWNLPDKSTRVELLSGATASSRLLGFEYVTITGVESISDDQGGLVGSGVRLHLGGDRGHCAHLDLLEHLVDSAEFDGEALCITMGTAVVRIFSRSRDGEPFGPEF